MPYAIVIWKRGSNVIDIAGLKPEDLIYLEKIPCMSSRSDVDTEGFVRFGTPHCSSSSLSLSSNLSKSKPKNITIKPAVILTGLEVLGFKVVTTTASACTLTKGDTNIASSEYSWTLRRDFAEPEPQD